MQANCPARTFRAGRSVHPPFTGGCLEKAMKILVNLALAILLLAPCLHVAASESNELAMQGCLPASEAREIIAEYHLVNSTTAMSNAAQKVQADALAGRLCRSNQQFIFEITLLRRDGRVIHAFVEALTGKVVGTQNVE